MSCLLGLQSHRPARCVFILMVMSALANNSVIAGDEWSTYRGDSARHGFLNADLPTDLNYAWQVTPLQEPRPAWPAPARGSYWQQLSYIAPRIIDDNTFHPVVAGHNVLWASSGDDSIHCVDLATGKPRWQFTTGGPVRYAPSVTDGKVYVGSDDGQVYCCELATGNLVWQKRLAPSDRLIPGNSRIISAWPIRTGVAVESGIAYAAAGLYPSQGVFVHALDAATGKEIWKSKIDYTAHGYLLLTDDYLVVPTGRSTPVTIRKSDGVLTGQLPGTPGSYAVVAGADVLSGRGNDGSLTASDIETRQSLLSLRAEQIAVSDGTSYLLSGNRLAAMKLVEFVDLQRRIPEHDKQIQKAVADRKVAADAEPAERERLDKVVEQLKRENSQLQEQRKACNLWETTTDKVGAIAACNTFVAIGGQDGIELRNPADGELLAELPVEGDVVGLALTKDGLVAATGTGQIFCFATDAIEGHEDELVPPVQLELGDMDWESGLNRLIEESLRPTFGSTRGYALVVGADKPGLVVSLASATDYTIVVVDDNREAVERLRETMHGHYGTRVAVLHISEATLPFADYIFNLVVTTGDDAAWTEVELARVTRPFGGALWEGKGEPRQRGPLEGAGQWTHQYGSTSNTAVSGDHYLTSQLQLQWFGGPGPSRMVDRHLRAPAPLISEGRMFVPGENLLVCVDSYNGTEYWQLDAPNSQRYSMPFDCGYSTVVGNRLAMAVGGELWLVNVIDGVVEKNIPVPDGEATAHHWGYVAMDGERIYGSRQLATASRTEPSRGQISVDYDSHQPIVTGQSLFGMNDSGEHLLWEFKSTILNPTITLIDGVIYCVASDDETLAQHSTGRIPLAEFLAHAPELIALDATTGDVIWREPLPEYLKNCTNILYLQANDERLILSGSRVHQNDSWYRVAVLERATGQVEWTAEHANGRAGALGHGEQVHHPVVLGDTLVCEPVLYKLSTGERTTPPGEPAGWNIQRPGHSCGTMSGAADCLLFRANNPTILDLSDGPRGSDRFSSISPTRPGCWINIIAADGLVLIPEASASCVCHYSLQTSMALQPIKKDASQKKLPEGLQ